MRLSNMGSWTAGFSTDSEKKETVRDYDDSARRYVKKLEKRAQKRQERSVRQDANIDVIPEHIAPLPRSVREINHLSGLSGLFSQLINSSDPYRPVIHGGYSAQTPQIQIAKPPPKAFIGDFAKFTEHFVEIAPEKYGTEVFRLNEAPAAAVLKDYKASNKQDALKYAWPQVRESLGFKGDCRYPWEKVAQMNLGEIIAAQLCSDETLNFSESWGEQEKFIHKNGASGFNAAEQIKIFKIAKEKLASVLPRTITSKAATLSHQDLGSVRNWGKDLDNARVKALRSVHDNTIRTALHSDGKLNDVNAELVKLLRTKSPKGLSGSLYKTGLILGWNKAVKPVHRTVHSKSKSREAELEHIGEIYDYRAMDEAQKKKHEDKLIQQLEDVLRETMEREEDRIVYAEDAALIAEKYQMLLVTYRRALSKNRTRILTEARDGGRFKTGAEENGIVSADKVKHTQSALDDRIEALDESAEICQREREHYESLAALHQLHKKNLRMAVNHSLEKLRDFERRQQQVMVTQNIALAGQYALNLDGMKLEKQIETVIDRLREARAEEVEALGTMKKAMDTDEILVLDYQAPIALIEHQKILALPAPVSEMDEQAVSNDIVAPE